MRGGGEQPTWGISGHLGLRCGKCGTLIPLKEGDDRLKNLGGQSSRLCPSCPPSQPQEAKK